MATGDGLLIGIPDPLVDPAIRGAAGVSDAFRQLSERVGGMAIDLYQSEISKIAAAHPHEIAAEQNAGREFNALVAKIDRDGRVPNVDGAVRSFRPGDDGRQFHVKPEFDANTHVFFVNGINTSPSHAGAEAAMLAGRMNHEVDLVYVRTQDVLSDVKAAFKETMDPAHGKMNPPERNLAAAIEQSLDRGENVHIVGYSRGALVTQLALENVRDHYLKQGHDEKWVEQRINPHITVETFNGASHHMPTGVQAEHYVSKGDYLVGNTIGMGPSAPEVRAIAARAIDGALALINQMPPDQRARLGSEVSALETDAAHLASDAGLTTNNHVPVLGGRNPAEDVVKFGNDLHDVMRDSNLPKSATPGRDEIARDGSRNSPNGPIHSVPIYIDTADLRAGRLKDWGIEQHDLPGMLATRQGHSTDARDIAGDAPAALKTAVERAAPDIGARGTPLPPVASVSAWDGKATSGTAFRVDDTTMAVHAGGGRYIVIDSEKVFGSHPPASNTFVDLRAQNPALTQGQTHAMTPPAQSLGR